MFCISVTEANIFPEDLLFWNSTYVFDPSVFQKDVEKDGQ